MSCYHHLTIEEREKLYLFENQGMSVRQIASLLHRSPSTISRELKRNAGLLPCQAQQAYQNRRRNCVRKSILSNRELCDQVRFLLGHLFWSPEQIANRLKYEQGHRVSTSTIYRALITDSCAIPCGSICELNTKRSARRTKETRSAFVVPSRTGRRKRTNAQESEISKRTRLWARKARQPL